MMSTLPPFPPLPPVNPDVQVILLGDMNVAHQAEDLARPKQNVCPMYVRLIDVMSPSDLAGDTLCV